MSKKGASLLYFSSFSKGCEQKNVENPCGKSQNMLLVLTFILRYCLLDILTWMAPQTLELDIFNVNIKCTLPPLPRPPHTYTKEEKKKNKICLFFCIFVNQPHDLTTWSPKFKRCKIFVGLFLTSQIKSVPRI